jgi:serine/threonine protein kinase
MEATLLTRLQHENIIEIYGVSSNNHTTTTATNNNNHHNNNKYSKETFQQPGGYFLVLQCMNQTLDGLIRTWRSASSSSSLSGESSEPTNNHISAIPLATVPSLSQRLETYGVGIVNAMTYLHSKRIVFRDLKPQNVGVDRKGKVRLYDFGIAQEMKMLAPIGKNHENQQEEASTTTTSIGDGSCCGSLRYLAPEVLLHRRANYPSDVYSFGVLLWQLCWSLEPPYYELNSSNTNCSLKTLEDFRQQVGRNHLRPSMEMEPTIPILQTTATATEEQQQQRIRIRNLIKSCWHACPEQRPTFPQLQQDLLAAERMVPKENIGPSKPTTTNTTTTALRRLRLPNIWGNRRRVMQVVLATTSTSTSTSTTK